MRSTRPSPMHTNNGFRLSELAKLPEGERVERLHALADAAMAPRNGRRASAAQARIDGYEAQFNMTSADMMAGLRAGTVDDTEDTAVWSMLVQANGTTRR